MNIKPAHFLLLLLTCCSLFCLSGCKSEEIDPITGQLSHDKINLWILENMNTYYYWQDKIPSSLDFSSSPDKFFESLLYRYHPTTRPDGDRFSWIQESAEELKSTLSGESKSTGMEFKLYRKNSLSDEIVGVVLYVLPQSPAAKAKIKRGDLFTKVNDQVLKISNYNTILSTNTGAMKFQFVTLNRNEGELTFQESETKEVIPILLQENPILLDTLLLRGNKKIGYLVYNQFNPSPNNASGADIYDQALTQYMQKIKAEGVNEFILDLRYNGGGYVSSARHLASLLAPNVTSKDIFAIKEYNSIMTQALTKEYGKDYFNDYFVEIPESIGNQLSRIFILTTQSTASASELTINGLKPYMNVIVVGDTTVGKNVGSVTISDRTKKIKWGLQPIVNKSFNSKKQSDYTAGFAPDIFVRENIQLYPFGDDRDYHWRAIEEFLHIESKPSARKSSLSERKFDKDLIEVDNSILKKTLGYNMFEDVILKKEN